MLGCIHPMSSPMMKRMLGLSSAAATRVTLHKPAASMSEASNVLIGISLLRPSQRSLLDLHVHAVGAQGELQALRGRHELHPDAVLVLHRAHCAAAGYRRAGGHAGVVA